MAGSIVRKRKGGREYFYWVRSARVAGRPRIVEQVYLGTAEALKRAREAQAPLVTRRRSAGPLVLWREAERLRLRAAIDAESERRSLPHSVGSYLQLVVCNRAHAPCAKLRLADWYAQSALPGALAIRAGELDHRRVWEAMGALGEAASGRGQERLLRGLAERGELDDGELLVFDPTNLFGYIASANERSQLARRGHNKQGRHDLRQVGLALLTTRTHRLPLMHYVYAGDRPDAPTLRECGERLQRRFAAVLERAHDVTLVYDRGSHSDAALSLFEAGELHFVCGLQAGRYRERLELPASELAPLAGLPGHAAARTQVMIAGRRYTLVTVHSQRFCERQAAGFAQTLAKALRQLAELERVLAGGRGRRTKSELQALADELLRPRYLKRVLALELAGSERAPRLAFELDAAALERLGQRVFGRSLLLSDRDDWSDEEIVRAYHALNRNEQAIRELKDPDYIAARPIYHWTDEKIRVHLFCCTLALLVSATIAKRARAAGIECSPRRLLRALGELDQIELVYAPSGGGRGRPRTRRHLGEPTELQLQLLEALQFDPALVGNTPPHR